MRQLLEENRRDAAPYLQALNQYLQSDEAAERKRNEVARAATVGFRDLSDQKIEQQQGTSPENSPIDFAAYTRGGNRQSKDKDQALGM